MPRIASSAGIMVQVYDLYYRPYYRCFRSIADRYRCRCSIFAPTFRNRDSTRKASTGTTATLAGAHQRQGQHIECTAERPHERKIRAVGSSDGEIVMVCVVGLRLAVTRWNLQPGNMRKCRVTHGSRNGRSVTGGLVGSSLEILERPRSRAAGCTRARNRKTDANKQPTVTGQWDLTRANLVWCRL